jgi:hypothetical protein
MDEREFREQPVVMPESQWMLPSDRMILRRYKDLDYLDTILRNGFRAQKADKYEELEGRASPPTLDHEEENWELNGVKLQNDSEPNLSDGLYEARKAARHNYYPSCWRMGTSEDLSIWEDYSGINEDNKRGIRFETTVGQMKQHFAPNEDLHMGVVWYQHREVEPTPNFPFYELYFFKDQQFDREKEFRAIANRGGNPILFIDGREWTEDMLPDDHPDNVYLKGNLDGLINRVLVAPEAGSEIHEEVEETLREHSVEADVVKSALDNGVTSSREYMAELIGPTNYSKSEEFLDFSAEHWLSSTDWNTWSTVDVVQINQQNNRHASRTLVELYRYSGRGPDFGTYGQDHLNYQVQAHRFDQNGHIETYTNEWADAFDQ